MSSGTSASKRPERFHGAFTGGFSAGFYNSVGTAEGWTPSTFSSSRDKRAAPREQRPEDFMDDEDGLLTEQLQAKPAFDTLGSTADEIAKQHAEREAAGGAIPGPAPSELIMPVGDPMGKKLLRTMGWREGQGVGSRVRRKRRRPLPAEGDESPEEDLPERALAGLGGKARELVDKEGLTFAPKNANKLQHVTARTNLHGVGHEPFKDAPEFGASRRAAGEPVAARGVYSTEDIVQRSHDTSAAAGYSRGPRAGAALHRGSHGFVLDDGEDDVYEAGFGKAAYDDALDEATHDSLAGAKAWALGGAGPEDEPMLVSRRYGRCPSDGRLPPTGFVVAQRPDVEQKHWAPPIPPANFCPTMEFENDVVAPLRVPSTRRHGGAGLNATGRARLLDEPSPRPVSSTPVAPTVFLDQGKARLPESSSALAFLSPTARKKLLDAANGTRAPSPFAPPSGSTAAEHSVGAGAGDARTQEGSNQPSDGLRFSLASKFTSETPPGATSGDAVVQVMGLVNPASHPAGLTLRTPASTDASKQSSSVPASEVTRGGAEVKKIPVRRTIDWTPAPLLCKRLNVPVPKASSTADWATKGGGAAASAERGIPSSLRKFVPESSASSLPKVPLLRGMEQRHPVGVHASAMSSDATAVDEETPKERPSIDLFKSIFESESESDSDDEDESGEEGTATAVGEAGSTPTGPPTEVRKAPKSLFDIKSRHRGYGTDSSDESTGADTGQLAPHRVDGHHSKKLEQGKSGEGKRPRGEGESRASRKHDHKHKKHKKDKKDKKLRKHEKRKKSSSRR